MKTFKNISDTIFVIGFLGTFIMLFVNVWDLSKYNVKLFLTFVIITIIFDKLGNIAKSKINMIDAPPKGESKNHTVSKFRERLNDAMDKVPKQ